MLTLMNVNSIKLYSNHNMLTIELSRLTCIKCLVACFSLTKPGVGLCGVLRREGKPFSMYESVRNPDSIS